MLVKDEKRLKERTRQFAVRIIRRYASLPKTIEAQVLGRQLLQSGALVGANFREACRGRSPAECAVKCRASLDRLEETAYWLELLVFSGLVPAGRLRPLRTECDELIATFITLLKRAKTKKTRK